MNLIWIHSKEIEQCLQGVWQRKGNFCFPCPSILIIITVLFTCIIWTVVFSVIPEGEFVLLGLVETGDCCWCPGELCGSALMLFAPFCNLVNGGGITAEVPEGKCLLFGTELERGLSSSWMYSLGEGPERQGAEPFTTNKEDNTFTNYTPATSSENQRFWAQ